jgi:Protein-tyrosine phosphatase
MRPDVGCALGDNLNDGSQARRRGTGTYDPIVGETWDPSAAGILRLPSGRLVRGRALSRPLPSGPHPALGVYLLGRRPPAVPWESRWLRWPDFRLPADEADVLPTLTEAWQRAAAERVEIACSGGRGRTGTALACLAILDGVRGSEAVAFVRQHYDPHAVETPGQCRYVARWPRER